MENKNLIFRYFIYFIISFIVLLFIINYFKQNSFESIKNSYKQEALVKYNRYYEDLNKTTQFIYFNEFIKSRNLISIFKKNDTKKIKDDLYDAFEPEFSYYKTLGLYDISFYSALNEPILNFQDINFEDTFNSKIVNEVILNKKEHIDIKTINLHTSILFSKPIIDEKLELIGVVNFEFSFNKIIDRLNSNSNLLFEKVILDNLANKEDIKDNSFILIPILELENNKALYLKSESLSHNQEFKESNMFYLFLTIFFTLNFALIYFLIYQASVQELKKNLIKNSYDELLSQVDNYVLKLDTDLKGNITFVTKYFCKISGYAKDEIIGKNANILRHPDMSSNFYKNLWHDLKIIKMWQGEVKNRDKFGNTYWVRTSLFPRYNHKKEHIGYSSIRTDITSTKQLEKTNRLLKEDLSSRLNDLRIKDKTTLSSTKVSLMSKILDSFSHQWKTPIAKISFELQRLQNLENYSQNSDIKEIKNSIETELQDLSNMLNETKTLFSSRPNMESNLFDIVKKIAAKIDDKAIDIRYDFDENIKLDIMSSELKNIIFNIISTICDLTKVYSLQKTVIKISVQNEEETNELVLKIEDNIKDDRKKEFLEGILKFEDDKNFDAKLYLAKLLIDKNQAIFWCNVSQDSTSYYIKFKKSNSL